MSAIDFASGCIGGAAGVLIGHPFDTIKVIMQTNTQRTSIMSVIKQSSINSLYRGIKAPLTGLAGINAIVFGVHGSIMRYCPHESSKEQRYKWCAISGSVSGLAQSLITCPMELVKTRAQLSSVPVMQCMRSIFHNEGGSRALFRGFGVTLARDCPGIATYFVAYEMLIDSLRRPNQELPSTWNLLVAGGTAGALSWLVIYPLDVIKSRLQADSRFTSTRHCVMDAFRQEGLGVFMRGCSPTLLRAFPSNAATFAVVTWTLYTYEAYKARRLDNHQILD